MQLGYIDCFTQLNNTHHLTTFQPMKLPSTKLIHHLTALQPMKLHNTKLIHHLTALQPMKLHSTKPICNNCEYRLNACQYDAISITWVPHMQII